MSKWHKLVNGRHGKGITMEQLRRATYRLPADAADFLERSAKRNLTSANAEVVRAIRERMERETKTATGQSLPAHPVAVPHETALQGGPAFHG